MSNTRQLVLFPPLEDIEFWDCRADLLAQHEGEVFIWNPETLKIHIVNHRDVTVDSALATQDLMLTQIPDFTITKISVSPSGSRVLLWGPKGIAVVIIPKRRKNTGTTTCRCTLIGERFFVGHSSISVTETHWFPNSLDDTHILVLTTDNVIRLYSFDEPLCAVRSYPIFDTAHLLPYISSLNVSCGPSILSAQSGKMVGFTIGSAQERKEGKENMLPIFILEENSDIYKLEISPDDTSKYQLSGPLKVLPVNSDFEVDACAIHCLPSQPPVLAIATLSGVLQHFALLCSDESEDESLYLLETVEIELPPSSAETPSEDGSSSSHDNDDGVIVTIVPDTGSRDRYFLRHNTGIHSIYLPAVQRLEQFVKDDSGDLNLECNCVAEHLICIQPLGSGDPTCLFGSVVVSDALLGNNIMVLISNAELVTLPLRPLYRGTAPLLADEATKLADVGGSPLKHIQKEVFSNKVQKILSRATSNPLLRCGSSGDMSQKAILELLMKCTQVFREEYVSKQNKARHELLHRMSILQELNSQNKSGLSEVTATIISLEQENASLQRRTSAVSKRRQSLCHRVTVLMRDLQALLPHLTTAEESFALEVHELSRDMKPLQQDADRLRQKLKFYDKATTDIPIISSNQQRNVKAMLKENDTRINSLVKEIKSAQIKLKT